MNNKLENYSLNEIEHSKKDYNWIAPFGVFFVILFSLFAYATFFSSSAKAEYNPNNDAALEDLEWKNGSPPAEMKQHWVKEGYTDLFNQPGAMIGVKNSSIERIDTETGNIIWSYSRPDATICHAIGHKGQVYVLFNPGGGCRDITTLDANTGKYINQAQYGTKEELARLVAGNNNIAIVTPHLVRLLRSSDLVPEATFGDDPVPKYKNDQSVENCDISDVVIGEKTFAVSSYCKDDDTYKIRLVKKDPEENSEGIVEKTIDTGSDKPVTLPAISQKDIIFVVQDDNPLAQVWNYEEDEPKNVVSYILPPGHIGYQYDNLSYFGYTWRIGDWVRYQSSSDNLSDGKDVAGAVGRPMLAGDKLLVPTYEGLAFVNFANDEQYDIKIEVPVSKSFAFSGKTFAALGEDGVIRSYQ